MVQLRSMRVCMHMPMVGWFQLCSFEMIVLCNNSTNGKCMINGMNVPSSARDSAVTKHAYIHAFMYTTRNSVANHALANGVIILIVYI